MAIIYEAYHEDDKRHEFKSGLLLQRRLFF